MAVNETHVRNGDGVGNGTSLIVDGGSSENGKVIVTEMGGTGGADIFRETDPQGDGSYSISVQMDNPSGSWHTQLNNLVVSSSEGVRIRITNTSGSAQDYYAVGKETQ